MKKNILRIGIVCLVACAGFIGQDSSNFTNSIIPQVQAEEQKSIDLEAMTTEGATISLQGISDDAIWGEVSPGYDGQWVSLKSVSGHKAYGVINDTQFCMINNLTINNGDKLTISIGADYTNTATFTSNVFMVGMHQPATSDIHCLTTKGNHVIISAITDEAIEGYVLESPFDYYLDQILLQVEHSDRTIDSTAGIYSYYTHHFYVPNNIDIKKGDKLTIQLGYSSSNYGDFIANVNAKGRMYFEGEFLVTTDNGNSIIFTKITPVIIEGYYDGRTAELPTTITIEKPFYYPNGHYTKGDIDQFGNFTLANNLLYLSADDGMEQIIRIGDNQDGVTVQFEQFTGFEGGIAFDRIDRSFINDIEINDHPIEKVPTTQSYEWKKMSDGYWHLIADGKTEVTDWAKVDGSWYFMNTSGQMQTGWVKMVEVWYNFGVSGAMQTGWQQINGIWYYFDTSGIMQTGWQKVNGIWYYFDGSGAMQTGWQKVNGIWYYFDGSGAMQTGWQQINGIWYYFDGSGAMQTGWLKIATNWYYLKADGSMAVSETYNGWKFNSNGEWIS